MLCSRNLPNIGKHVLARYLCSEYLNAICEVQHFKTPIPAKFECLPIPLYGGKYIITLLPGRGIGFELMEHIQEIIKACNAGINIEEILYPPTFSNSKEELHRIITSIKRNRVALKVSIEAENEGHSRNHFNLNIRSELDLYVSIVHLRSYPNVKCRNPELNFILARQNTEGEYLMLEHEAVKGKVEALKVVTKENTEKFARWALNYARAHRRKKVTIVHKMQVDPLVDGLFVDTIMRVSKNYNDFHFETMRLSPLIDIMIRRPKVLDFVMVPNLYGCVIINIASGLLGGPGLLSKKSFSSYYAIFEPAIGTVAKDLVGKDRVNPVAMLNALRDMLAYLNMEKKAILIDKVTKKVLCEDKVQTPDIGGSHTTTEFIERVIHYIRKSDVRN